MSSSATPASQPTPRAIRRWLAGVLILSTGILLAEVGLTRVFSIAQFHHFAFLLISLALLGFGASGSLLAVAPRLASPRLWPAYALGYAIASAASYLFVVHLPFDSFRIAWDAAHAWLLIANLLALAVPFGLGGLLIGAMLAGAPGQAGPIYGANLLGSAIGAIGAPIAITALGAERTALVAGTMGAVAALVLAGRRVVIGAVAGAVVVALIGLPLVAPGLVELQPSPYKRLSQLRLDPDTRLLATRQDSGARLDIVASPTIHSAPGLSLTYVGELPPQVGLLIDADGLLPVPRADAFPNDLGHAVPAAVAYSIRSGARTLLLGSGGGLPALAALANGAGEVTVVEPGGLVGDALSQQLRGWAGLADDPRVRLIHDEIRSFAARDPGGYQVVELTLTDAYRPVTSGAYSLTESPTLTTDAVAAYLRLLAPDGLLVVTRWLQTPPSEELRTLGLIVEALGEREPRRHIVAFRTFQTATFLVKATPFTDDETDALLAAIERRRYDLVLAPRIPSDLVNRFAVVERPLFHELAVELATTPDRSALDAASAFDIAPPTDDRPFFFHFFRWAQTPELLENLGRRWQPFGGSGYFVLLALLGFTILAALAFVVAPIALRRRFREALAGLGPRGASTTLAYFTALGLAYLLIEVALVQRSILVLGQPSLALGTVVGSLLLASGLGSLASPRLPWRRCLIGSASLALVIAVAGDLIAEVLLPLPLALRLAGVAQVIAPLGFLMGVPFARGVAALAARPALVPWAWAANGSASVVAGVLAALLSLSMGLTTVLVVGAGFYLLAAVTAPRG